MNLKTQDEIHLGGDFIDMVSKNWFLTPFFGGVCLLHTASFVGACNSNEIVSMFVIRSCNKKY